VSFDLAQLAAFFAFAVAIVGVLWRVGSVGKTVGEQMEKLGGKVDRLAERVGHLEIAKASAEARHLAEVEAELAELRNATNPPRPRPRRAGLL
jgi:hypothetical protein